MEISATIAMSDITDFPSIACIRDLEKKNALFLTDRSPFIEISRAFVGNSPSILLFEMYTAWEDGFKCSLEYCPNDYYHYYQLLLLLFSAL